MDATRHESGAVVIHVFATEGEVILDISGELDLACADLLEQVVEPLLTEPRRIVVDVSDLTFCDTFGLSALLELCERQAATGGGVRFVNPQPIMRRLCGLLGKESMLVG